MRAPEVLIVAQSARMLAQSARRGGWTPLGLDRFADVDTRSLCGYCEAVPGAGGDFDRDALLAAVERADPRGEAEGLVYGGGLENHPDLLEAIARHRPLLGNEPAVLRLLRRPESFFALLDEQDIAHPETRFSQPSDPAGWLAKQRCGEGGRGVFPCPSKAIAAENYYFQRQVEGTALSFLFLADGQRIRAVGFNRQWTVHSDCERPFLFAGIMGAIEIAPGPGTQIRDHARRLTERAGLVGLNSLDYICDGQTCRLLEVNPRPGASLALYDEDWREGLLAAHIRACRGELPEGDLRSQRVRGYEVLYAGAPVTIPPALEWPDWTADRPEGGSTLFQGQPICSLSAESDTAAGVEALLHARKGLLRQCLGVVDDMGRWTQ